VGPALLFAHLVLAPSEPARGKTAGYDEAVAVVVGITEYGAGRERLPNAAIETATAA
jgi:hypothetical protein